MELFKQNFTCSVDNFVKDLDRDRLIAEEAQGSSRVHELVEFFGPFQGFLGRESGELVGHVGQVHWESAACHRLHIFRVQREVLAILTVST